MIVNQVQEAQSVLTISNLTFGYANSQHPTLQDISLRIRTGEIITILGGSGCGKSTLLNLVAGLLKPQAGEIQIGNKDGTTGNRNIGYIFQEDALLPWRKVRANLALALELKQISPASFEKSLPEYLDTFHLSESILDRYPAQLSGGMRQRVSIMQALLFNAQLLLLDEPFSALDFYTKLCLESEFYNLVKSSNKAALLVTHDIEEAIAISDRVIVFKQSGTIEADLPIRFDGVRRDPENLRGLPKFADYYQAIWSRLKMVMSQ